MKPDFLRSFEFFTGVPDSLLAPLCTWLMQEYGLGKDHIIAANEGNCVALAAGYLMQRTFQMKNRKMAKQNHYLRKNIRNF